jgi:hypothetical protein
MDEKVERVVSFMGQEAGRRIGEVKIKKYIVKNDSGLLRLEKATVRGCSVPEDEAKSRGCTELGKAEGRGCEELVLVYRPSGCIREKSEVDLDEVTTVRAANVEGLKDKKIRDKIEM